jgi:hypothetical protein
MKKLFLPALLFAMIFTIISCQKADLRPSIAEEQSAAVQQPQYVQNLQNATPALGREGEEHCPATVVTLIAGQTIDAGTVTVSNDAEYIYVTYTTANGWFLTQTHLYVGDCALIPINNPGNPIPGQFPYSSTHNRIDSYTYQIPLSKIPEGTCGCIAAHAVVVQVDGNGNSVNQQTAWGNGVRINLSGGNWGMKFDYCSCVYVP